MDLELGLSLSNCPPNKLPSMKQLDLISHVNFMGKKGLINHGDDDCCSIALSCQISVNDSDFNQDDDFLCKKKRGFYEVESSKLCKTKTLPLFVWDDQPNEDDKKFKRTCNSTPLIINKNEVDEIVGWPPIKTYRKKQNEANQPQPQGSRAVDNGGSCGGCVGCGGSWSMFVKVHLEGYLIARKIDLKLFHSYEPLMSNLLYMFGLSQEYVDYFKVTYLDANGDWLLVKDVPWRSFIGTVQRMKIVRRDD